jgi:hypothetical protein
MVPRGGYQYQKSERMRWRLQLARSEICADLVLVVDSNDFSIRLAMVVWRLRSSPVLSAHLSRLRVQDCYDGKPNLRL